MTEAPPRSSTTEGFLEVETPLLQSGARRRDGQALQHASQHARPRRWYLRIAPELYLKRLVVGGFEKRLRDRSATSATRAISTRHNPEFTMLEYYMAYATYEDQMDLIEALIKFVRRGRAGGASATRWSAERDVRARTTTWKRVPLRERAILDRVSRRGEGRLEARTLRSLARRSDDRGRREARRLRAEKVLPTLDAERQASCMDEAAHLRATSSSTCSTRCFAEVRPARRSTALDDGSQARCRCSSPTTPSRSRRSRAARTTSDPEFRRSLRALRAKAASSPTPSPSSTTRSIRPRAFTRPAREPGATGDDEAMDFDADYIQRARCTACRTAAGLRSSASTVW